MFRNLIYQLHIFNIIAYIPLMDIIESVIFVFGIRFNPTFRAIGKTSTNFDLIVAFKLYLVIQSRSMEKIICFFVNKVLT